MPSPDLDPKPSPSPWPPWKKRLVSALLAFHICAILTAALAASPASLLERRAADLFLPYDELINQGHGYRFYAPEPPPTPVVEATLKFKDGRPDRTIRLPDPSAKPRLIYQRQLALAMNLFTEHRAVKDAPVEAAPHRHWAPSYARHLGAVHGCSSVVFAVKIHLIPDPNRVAEALRAARTGAGSVPFDLDSEEMFTVPERIGEFPCDAS